MENNVNCKETRFVIRKLVDLDDVSPAMVPEIGKLTGDESSPVTMPEIPFDVGLNYVGISPKRKG